MNTFAIGENINNKEVCVKETFDNLLSLTKEKLESRLGVSRKKDFWKSFEEDVHAA
jgi:hypothetical protein